MYTFEEYVQKAKDRFGDQYIYVEMFTNDKRVTYLNIECKTHGP